MGQIISFIKPLDGFKSAGVYFLNSHLTMNPCHNDSHEVHVNGHDDDGRGTGHDDMCVIYHENDDHFHDHDGEGVLVVVGLEGYQ